MTYFKDIYNLALREKRKVFGDINLALMFLIAPIIYPFLYGFFYLNKVEEKVPTAYIDYDNSMLSRQLIREIGGCQNINITHKINNYSEIEYELMYNKCEAVVVIPQDFSLNIKRGKSTNVNMILPAGRLLVLSDIGLPMYYASATYGSKIAASFAAKKGSPIFTNPSVAQPIKFNMQFLNNPYLTYGDMFLPALSVIILSQILFIGGAAAQAKEYGINKRLEILKSTNHYSTVIFADIIFYMGIFTFVSLVLAGVLSPIYKINILYNYFDLYLVSIIGMSAALIFGMFIGTFFKHRITVFVILAFTSYPFFLMTGYAWPWDQLPTAIQYLSRLIPMTPFAQSYQIISQFGNNISYAAIPVINSLALIVFYSLLYIIRMNYLKRKNKYAL